MTSSANPPSPLPIDDGEEGGSNVSSSSAASTTEAASNVHPSRKRKKNNSGASLSWEAITDVFHLPLTEAAKKIGVCDTVLKQQCRKLGLKKWPHRQFRQITNMIEQLESHIASSNDADSAVRMTRQAQLEELQGAMQSLLTTGQLTVNITKRRRSFCTSGAVKREGGPSSIPASVLKPFSSQPEQTSSNMVPETGFRTSNAATTLLGGVLEDGPGLRTALLESSGNLTRSERSQLLEMDFSTVFDDEQEAKFSSSGSISHADSR